MQKLLLGAGIVFMLFVGCLALTTSRGGGGAAKTEAYENDLTERCKDWLYWREQILTRNHAGDAAGAGEARRTMNVFMRDLERRFTAQQIADEIGRLEDRGRRKGVPPWRS